MDILGTRLRKRFENHNFSIKAAVCQSPFDSSFTSGSICFVFVPPIKMLFCFNDVSFLFYFFYFIDSSLPGL